MLGMYDTEARCPTCRSKRKLKPSFEHKTAPAKKLAAVPMSPAAQKRNLKKYDALIDKHPNIDKEIEKAREKVKQVTKQWEVKRDDSLTDAKDKLKTEKSRLAQLKNEWERAWGHRVDIYYAGRLMPRSNRHGQVELVADPTKESHLFDIRVRGNRLAKVPTHQIRRSVDTIVKLENQIEGLLTEKQVPNTLRNLQRKLTDTQEVLNSLEKDRDEIVALEQWLKLATPAKKSTKKAIPTARGGLNWKDAETLARDFMRQIGFTDARLTTAGRDGGVDIRARDGIAQVKWHIAQVGSPDLQALYGIAALEKKTALFFAQRYSPDAVRWGNASRMALFKFTASGHIEAVNATARTLI